MSNKKCTCFGYDKTNDANPIPIFLSFFASMISLTLILLLNTHSIINPNSDNQTIDTYHTFFRSDIVESTPFLTGDDIFWITVILISSFILAEVIFLFHNDDLCEEHRYFDIFIRKFLSFILSLFISSVIVSIVRRLDKILPPLSALIIWAVEVMVGIIILKVILEAYLKLNNVLWKRIHRK
jgi:hypothetical protein